MKKEPQVFRTADGEAYCWLEQKSSVMLKAVTKSGDPVELTKEEAVALANALLKYAEARSQFDPRRNSARSRR